MSDPTPAEALMIHRNRACEYSERFGIYAVPVGVRNSHWKPRTSRGYDPGDGCFDSSHPHGWPTWADAVVALGTWMEGQEG